MAETKRRFDVGMSSSVAVLQAETDLAQLRTRLEELMATLDLRRRALAGAVKPEDILPALRRLELEKDARRLELDARLAQARIEEVRRLVAVGQAAEIDLKRAELVLLERQVELQRVRQEIAKLAAGKRD
jgi:hypothetical protein